MSFSDVTPEHREAIEKWIAAEPAHANNTFEFYTEPGAKSLVLSTEKGDVLVIKFSPCLRLHADSNPSASPEQIAEVVSQGLPALAVQAKAQGFREFIFSTDAEAFEKVAEVLGFRKSPDFVGVL